MFSNFDLSGRFYNPWIRIGTEDSNRLESGLQPMRIHITEFKSQLLSLWNI